MSQQIDNEKLFTGLQPSEEGVSTAHEQPESPTGQALGDSEGHILDEEIDKKKESIFHNAKNILNINNAIRKILDGKTTEEIEELISNKISKEASKHIFEEIIDEEIKNKYRVIFLYSGIEITRAHATRIHACLYSEKQSRGKKDILLFLKSKGGELETAYLISKMCGKSKKGKFIIAIPAEAKSAATLLSLGADEIHMGPLSELGPIDPQIDGYPALAFASAIEKLARISVSIPGSEKIFSEYLAQSKLNLINLGHYERKTASASQYATRLLNQRTKNTDEIDKSKMSDEDIAAHLTTHFKDHNFVIDTEEAIEILGSDIVKAETKEYYLSQEVNSFLENLHMSLSLMANKEISISIVGDKIIVS